MQRRWARVAVFGALVAGLVAAQGMPSASGEDDEHPVGYTLGTPLRGDTFICNFYEIDLTTAEATQVNPAGQLVGCGDGLTFDDDGTLYAYRNDIVTGPGVEFAELITIDLDDGSQHVVGQLPSVLVGGGGMTFDAEGDLWLYAAAVGDAQCADFAFCLWEVDPENAQSELVGQAPVDRGVFGLTGDCEDVIAITSRAISGFTASQVQLDEVHTSNASLEPIVDLPTVGFPSGLDFEDDGDLWALGFAGSGGAGIGPTLYRIDPTDGTAQAKDITLGGAPLESVVNGLAVDPIECEEPEPEPPAPQPTPVVVEPVFTG